MSEPQRQVAAADLLVRRLAEYGVGRVFGYPGGQLTPIYDALYRQSAIRHILARHEQAAAFMADGAARATGRPGVCLAVCGPGVFNAATPLSAAFTDSVPVLLISGQIPTAGRGLRSGYYHENDQLAACATLTKHRDRADSVDALIPTLDRCWAKLTSGRAGPVLLEVPLNVLRAETPAEPWPVLPAPPTPAAPAPRDVEALARLVAGWRRPLILAGGGVVSAGAEAALRHVAERLGAPVFHTAMGKCVLPADHPLAQRMPWRRATADVSGMNEFFSPLFAEADGLLAVGCRFSQLTTGSWVLRVPPSLAQIDVDADEIGRHYAATQGIVADARLVLQALLALLPAENRLPWAAPRTGGEPWRLPGMDITGPLRGALPPDAIVAADVTRLAYVLMAEFPATAPRTFLHPAGAVAMGYALPAALGAKAAFPDRTVVAVVGDGGFLMSGMELATAVQERLPVIVVLVNDSCLTLIRATQERRYGGRFIGVDLQNPDFGALVRAFGVRYTHADSDDSLEMALREARDADRATVVEVSPADAQK
ncbi:MAG TPA: thiamine pyrophosphate-binding protein [Gemmataceae bacterium]|nr:thiamine pyrophosphate-binding protein [Gemmataceae bacterium]